MRMNLERLGYWELLFLIPIIRKSEIEKEKSRKNEAHRQVKLCRAAKIYMEEKHTAHQCPCNSCKNARRMAYSMKDNIAACRSCQEYVTKRKLDYECPHCHKFLPASSFGYRSSWCETCLCGTDPLIAKKLKSTWFAPCSECSKQKQINEDARINDLSGM